MDGDFSSHSETSTEAWVTAREVADHLGVETSYVYQHAAKLGARRLGTGPKARLRFRLALVEEALLPVAQPAGESHRPHPPRRRRASRTTHSHAPLLPIRARRSVGR
jgi:hypothetical protein